jgi:hypothetical protein
LHVFAQGTDNHLLEFYKDAGPWQVFDHTTDPGINRKIASSPVLHWEGAGTALHVFAQGTDSDLLEFYKDAGPWQIFDQSYAQRRF